MICWIFQTQCFVCRIQKLAYYSKSLCVKQLFRQEPHIYPHNLLKISRCYEDFLFGGLKIGLKIGKMLGK